MPALYYTSSAISRKTFLQQTLKAAGLTLLSVHSLGFSNLKAQAAPLQWALLSDIHISANRQDAYRGFVPYNNLQQVVAALEKTAASSVLINGDIARLTGQPDDYAQVKQLLQPVASRMPVYMTLGNHDDRVPFQQAFAPDKQQPVEDKHVLLIETPVANMILLDSLLYVDKVPGLLGKAQRQWLEQYLQQARDKPILLFVHHTLGDGDTDLLDVERLFSLVKPHKQVKAIFYGHSHEYKYDTLEGIHLVNQPAVGYNFEDAQPVGWLNASFRQEGVTLSLQAIGGNRQQHGKSTELSWRR